MADAAHHPTVIDTRLAGCMRERIMILIHPRFRAEAVNRPELAMPGTLWACRDVAPPVEIR
jgi:hypothetical protein